jgi:hypothetical protein
MRRVCVCVCVCVWSGGAGKIVIKVEAYRAQTGFRQCNNFQRFGHIWVSPRKSIGIEERSLYTKELQQVQRLHQGLRYLPAAALRPHLSSQWGPRPRRQRVQHRRAIQRPLHPARTSLMKTWSPTWPQSSNHYGAENCTDKRPMTDVIKAVYGLVMRTWPVSATHAWSIFSSERRIRSGEQLQISSVRHNLVSSPDRARSQNNIISRLGLLFFTKRRQISTGLYGVVTTVGTSNHALQASFKLKVFWGPNVLLIKLQISLYSAVFQVLRTCNAITSNRCTVFHMDNTSLQTGKVNVNRLYRNNSVTRCVW